MNRVFRLVVFDLRRKHDVCKFADLPYDCGKCIVCGFSFNVHSFAKMIIILYLLMKRVVQFIKHQFSVCVQVKQIIFIGFYAYFFQ
jgi:hypothetical protein